LTHNTAYKGTDTTLIPKGEKRIDPSTQTTKKMTKKSCVVTTIAAAVLVAAGPSMTCEAFTTPGQQSSVLFNSFYSLTSTPTTATNIGTVITPSSLYAEEGDKSGPSAVFMPPPENMDDDDEEDDYEEEEEEITLETVEMLGKGAAKVRSL
jgi:hypothetical protein